MKTREIIIDGEKFQIMAWTVKDRKNFFNTLTNAGNLPPAEQYGKVVEFIAEQIGKTEKEVEQMDAVLVDKLLDAIIKANQAPLGPQRT